MTSLARYAGEVVEASLAFGRAGLLKPLSPQAIARGGLAVMRDGVSPAAAYELAAARFGEETAIVDDRGEVGFRRFASEISEVAGALERAGVGSRDRVGLLCRNHRDMIRTLAAASAVGADVVLLNTSFAAPQLSRVLADQGVTVLVYDEDLAPATAETPADVLRYVARRNDGSSKDVALEDLPPGRRSSLRLAITNRTRYVLLTSGTTGRPRGAARPVPHTLGPLVGLLSRIPLKVRDTVLIASPMFHAWGFAHLGFALGLAETIVLEDRFDPESVLAAIETHRVQVLVAVPVMLQRMIDLAEERRCRYDVSSLRVVAVSGSALAAGLAVSFMDVFGEVVYNLYGSTEAGWVSIATPADLRAAPQSAGHPPIGTSVRIADSSGSALPAGSTGRILVRNALVLGGGLLRRDFLDTGDMGYVDGTGRLFVVGRSDDMIVSGGENVYPEEVEEVLATHPAIAEVAVVGVPDERFGQRLRALVVLRHGSHVGADEVKRYVRDRLARFKVPRDVEFVSALPRNATGKILRAPAASD